MNNEILINLFNNICNSFNEYSISICPFVYIAIDPKRILYHSVFSMKTKRKFGSKLFDWGKIIDGNWDVKRKKLSTKINYNLICEHYLYNIPWTDTKLFKNKIDRIKTHGKVDGCTTRDELIYRYNKLDLLYQNLEKSRKLLPSIQRGRFYDDDLFISIGSDGTYFLTHGGIHRLAIAQLLSLDRIPVLINYIHSDFINKNNIYDFYKHNMFTCF